MLRVKRAEQDKIEADRAETKRMMQELLQMKAQMAQNEQKLPEKTDFDPYTNGANTGKP